MRGRLEGKVAVVTGGARGIGEATVRRFHQEGASVVITDIREELGVSLAAALGERAMFVRHDVALRNDWDAMLASVDARFGPVSILVNNAGMAGAGAFLDKETDESYSQIVSINQTGVFFGIRAVVPYMTKAGGGSIINVSSTSGLVAYAGLGSYTATKFAVVGLTKAAALEFGKLGIRVNCVNPGVVDTPLVNQVSGEVRGDLDSMIAKLPIARFAHPEELAGAILFFASEDSAFCTGASLAVDGGWTAA